MIWLFNDKTERLFEQMVSMFIMSPMDKCPEKSLLSKYQLMWEYNLCYYTKNIPILLVLLAYLASKCTFYQIEFDAMSR